MLPQSLQESTFTTAARGVYRAVRSVYRGTRAFKNRLCNLIDQPIIILLYHRVTDLPADPEMLAVSPLNFRQHLKYLKQNFPILRFEENWPDNKERAVAITFDDGYADNILEALPVLEELEVPATFFVSTGHIGTTKEFWWNQLELILLGERNFPSRFVLDDNQYGQSWNTATPEERKILYTALNARMKKITRDRQEAWLAQLKHWAGSLYQIRTSYRSMTRAEVKELAASPWAAVGAHTQSHTALSALTQEQQRKEILKSKQDLENIIGKEITTFSYPFGRKSDYNRTSVALCREAGFKKAASNFSGQVHRWTDPFQLPRHLVRNWDVNDFAVEMNKFWTR